MNRLQERYENEVVKSLMEKLIILLKCKHQKSKKSY